MSHRRLVAAVVILIQPLSYSSSHNRFGSPPSHNINTNHYMLVLPIPAAHNIAMKYKPRSIRRARQKSMEKFMSVISSFKCTSSGSPASGLRAPLKDTKTLNQSIHFCSVCRQNDQANTKRNLSTGDDEIMVANEYETSDGEPKSVFCSVEVKMAVENRMLHTSRYFRDNNQENANERHIETPNIEGFAMKRKFSIVDDSVQKVSTLSSFNLCV
ncbi:hypothetical protein Tco_0900764 [Tanacetum coccineum]